MFFKVLTAWLNSEPFRMVIKPRYLSAFPETPKEVEAPQHSPPHVLPASSALPFPTEGVARPVWPWGHDRHSCSLGFWGFICSTEVQSWWLHPPYPVRRGTATLPHPMRALSHSEEEAGSSPGWKWPQNGSFCAPSWDFSSPNSRTGPSSLIHGPWTPLASRWPLKT